jgi:putative spermidine/putrescine transport system ATP-binding protein
VTASLGATVELRQCVKRFGGFLAVDGVSLRIAANEFVTLLGPSGSGKTTSLLMVAGFEVPDSGQVLIGERDVTRVPSYRRNLGFVFQHYALFPHMTVFENLAFPLATRGVLRAEIRRRVPAALEKVRLHGLEDRFPAQLSGGQQQRVALARAIIFDPPVLLMDEPLGALDKKLREQMQLEIKQLQRDLHVTVVYVTHDQEEALAMSDRIAVMNGGRIVQVAPPEELYERPVDEFVADFVGQINLLRGRVERRIGAAAEVLLTGGTRLRAALPGDIAEGSEVALAIRPERVLVRPAGAGASFDGYDWHEGVVEEATYLGNGYRYGLRVAGLRLIAQQQASKDSPVMAAGMTAGVGWHPQDIKLVQRRS